MLRSPVAAAKPHDQTSSVTYGRYGAKSRSSTREPLLRGRHGRAAAGGVRLRARAGLHELEVVVGVAGPEEALDGVERARVVELLEERRRALDRVAQPREEAQRRAGGSPVPPAALCESTYFAALKSFVTSRRPTLNTFSSNAVSVPRRAASDQ